MAATDFVSFSAHVNKATKNVHRLQWSPVDDLVAVVFEEPTVTLYRLPWQRVWAFPTESTPTSLCWSPNGKQLAIGLQDGNVEVISKENGAAVCRLPRVRSHGGVLCLSWVDIFETSEPDSRSFQTLCSKMNSMFCDVPTEFPSQPVNPIPYYKKLQSVVEDERRRDELDTDKPTVLIAGRETGQVCCYLQGKVPILEFNSSALLGSPHPEEAIIHEVSLTNDLSAILLLQSVTRVSSDPNISAKSTLQLVLYEAPCLARNLKQIRDLSLRLTETVDLLKESEKCMTTLCKQWTTMVNSLHTLMTLEDVSLDDLRDELVIFIGLQFVTKTLVAFCEQKWGYTDLQRMAKTMDTTFRVSDEVITDHLRIHLQKAVLIIEDLCSLIETSELLLEDTLCLKAKDLHELQGKMKWSLFRVDMIQERLSSMGKQYRLFMCLLLLVQQCHEHRDMSDTNIINKAPDLLDFLQEGFLEDPIKSEFQKSDDQENHSKLVEDLKQDTGLWEMMNQVLEEYPWSETQPGLRQQLHECKALAEFNLQTIKSTLSQDIILKQKISLAGSLNNPVNRIKLHNFFNPESELHQFLIILNCLGGRLRTGVAGIAIFRGTLTKKEKNVMVSVEASMVIPPKESSIIDLGLCRTSQVLVLMKRKESTKTEIISIEMSDWPFSPLAKKASADRRSSEELVKGLKDHGVDIGDLPKRQRTHNYIGVRPPFAVNDRDLAIVVSDHRVMIYDLETDDRID